MGAAHADDMAHQQQGYEQAEGQLNPFVHADPQASASDEYGNAERKMRNERGSEDDCAGQAAGDGDAHIAHRLHGIDRHQADRVVEEVRHHEGKKDEACDKPQLAQCHARWRKPAREGDISHACLSGVVGLAHRIDYVCPNPILPSCGKLFTATREFLRGRP